MTIYQKIAFVIFDEIPHFILNDNFQAIESGVMVAAEPPPLHSYKTTTLSLRAEARGVAILMSEHDEWGFYHD